MKLAEFFAIPGSGLTDTDANIIGPEILRLRSIGHTSARAIKQAAISPDSPLHPYVYDRPIEEAAEKHYLNRAGHILRSITIEVHVAEQPRRMRAFFPIHVEGPNQSERGERDYLPISEINADADYMRQLLQDAMRQLLIWRSRHKDLDDYFGPVLRAIEQVENEIAA